MTFLGVWALQFGSREIGQDVTLFKKITKICEGRGHLKIKISLEIPFFAIILVPKMIGAMYLDACRV